MGKLTKAKNRIFWIIIVIVISLTVINFSYMVILKSSRRNIAALHRELSHLSKTISFKDSIVWQQLNLKFLFEKKVNKDACDTLLMNESKIILLFSIKSCRQCIVKNIMDLNIISEKIGKERIILAGDFLDRKSFENYLSNLPYYDFKHILFRDITNLSDLKIDVPVIILLDTNYCIKLLFYDYKENLFLRDLFFERYAQYII